MSGLTELLARVEAATGPDREIDGALWLATDDEAIGKCWGVRGMTYAGHVHTKAEKAAHIKRMSEYSAAAYTASIDAALALVERMLPEANCVGFDKTPLGVDAYVSRNNVQSGHWMIEALGAKTAPLALVAALLRALISRTPAPGGKPG